MSTRVGLFGGTFDPVHLGHLIIAEQCLEQASLNEVWFLPSFRPPHKSDAVISSFDRRTEMLTLAIAGCEKQFRIEPIEKDRTGPSYTVDTVTLLQERHPDTTFHLILGADCLPDLPMWHEPDRLVSLVSLLIVDRPGWSTWTVEHLAEALKVPPGTINAHRIESPLTAIASRDLRRRVSEKRSIRFMVPNAVAAYIHEKKMYQG